MVAFQEIRKRIVGRQAAVGACLNLVDRQTRGDDTTADTMEPTQRARVSGFPQSVQAFVALVRGEH
ncbi:MAG: hypothetical protein CMJ65_02535 [Planctomycetaceae bacterium]|nr:hypothetical protein [Planctomycetaceae bacterium]